MSTLISVFLLFTHLVTFVNANLIDDATRLESELSGSKIERNAKNLVSDVTTLELLDELKKEVLHSNDHDQLKTKLHDILRKKESEILSKAKSDVKKEVAKKVIEPAKEISVSTSEDFFKAAGSRDDDFAEDPEAKRAIEMMIDDLLTKEIKALPDDIQKRGTKCEDTIKHCKFLADKGRCHNNKRIVEYCPKSCLMCKAATPPKCSKSTFGCCWDKVTVKKDKEGKNCPVCKDNFSNVCKMFKSDCGQFSKAGDFMTKNCKRSCNLCEKGCKDDPKMSFYCSFWKTDLDWCKTKKNMMMHYCPITCGFC